MIFGPSSHRTASLKSRYIKATCRNKRCSEFIGSPIGVVGGIKQLVTTSSAFYIQPLLCGLVVNFTFGINGQWWRDSSFEMCLESMQKELITSVKDFHSLVYRSTSCYLAKITQWSWLIWSTPKDCEHYSEAFPKEVKVPCWSKIPMLWADQYNDICT